MDSQTLVDRAARLKPQPVYVLCGDEDFLRRQARTALRTIVLGTGDESFGLTIVSGDKATFAEVHDELETLPFLGSRRMVVVEGADPFVTRWRSALEKYVAKPAATGVLVLDVKSWPANTRLAKLIPEDGTIVCKGPAPYRLPDWCTRRAISAHGKELTRQAAELLVQLVGVDMGQLDQELTKLSLYVGTAKRIDAGDVDKLVGHSRAEDTWEIFKAIGNGRPQVALAILDRALDQGEDAMRNPWCFQLPASPAGPGVASGPARSAARRCPTSGWHTPLCHPGRRTAVAPSRPPAPQSALRLAARSGPRPQGIQSTRSPTSA